MSHDQAARCHIKLRGLYLTLQAAVCSAVKVLSRKIEKVNSNGSFIIQMQQLL
jgi:hypothetical protein